MHEHERTMIPEGKTKFLFQKKDAHEAEAETFRLYGKEAVVMDGFAAIRRKDLPEGVKSVVSLGPTSLSLLEDGRVVGQDIDWDRHDQRDPRHDSSYIELEKLKDARDGEHRFTTDLDSLKTVSKLFSATAEVGLDEVGVKWDMFSMGDGYYEPVVKAKTETWCTVPGVSDDWRGESVGDDKTTYFPLGTVSEFKKAVDYLERAAK